MQCIVPKPQTKTEQSMGITFLFLKFFLNILKIILSFGSLKIGTRTILFAI